MSGLLIKSGRVLDPKNGVDELRDIYIRDGKIVKNYEAARADRVFDAAGMLVTPGLVDLHVHFRDPGQTHKETLETGSRAAAAGGFTAVCCMPNTTPAADSAAAISQIHRRGKELGLVNLFQFGALSKAQRGESLADLSSMAEAGAPAFSDDGRTLADCALMREAVVKTKELGLFISDHAEPEAEIVERDIALARETGCHIHLQHISLKESVRQLREAKRGGVNITAETAPHYFALTKDALRVFGPNAKMNPPLGTESDRLAILEGITDGTFDCIATDHAPHSAEEKSRPLKAAPNGIIGLETAFAVSYTVLVRGGYIGLEKLIRLMSVNPANILNTAHRGLAPGAAADLAVFDVGNAYRVDASRFASKGRNCPFDGMKAYGKTKLTVLGGKIVYEEDTP